MVPGKMGKEREREDRTKEMEVGRGACWKNCAVRLDLHKDVSKLDHQNWQTTVMSVPEADQGTAMIKFDLDVYSRSSTMRKWDPSERPEV